MWHGAFSEAQLRKNPKGKSIAFESSIPEFLIPLSSDRLCPFGNPLFSAKNILSIIPTLPPRALLNINIQPPVSHRIILISTHTAQPRPFFLATAMEFLGRLSTAGVALSGVHISTGSSTDGILR